MERFNTIASPDNLPEKFTDDSKFPPFCPEIDMDFGFLAKFSNELKRSIEKRINDRLKKQRRVD